MVTYTVQPAADGYDMQGNWETLGPAKRTGHTRKQAALNEARRRASTGDTLIIKRTDGSIQDKRTIQSKTNSGPSETEEEATQPMPWGERWAREKASEGTGIDFFSK